MKFYIFNQNNSGGYWDKILGFKVIIEPENLAKELEDIKRRQKDWELSSTIRYADGRVEEII